jgi:hypothetical protein
MKEHNWDMNSVVGFVRILRESEPDLSNELSLRYSIPFDCDDELLILASLDEARKAHDSRLAALGHEAQVYDHHRVLRERVILNSLRKWSGPVHTYIDDADSPMGKSREEVSVNNRQLRERTAIDGFITRNHAARAREGHENTWLLGEMAVIVRRMLSGFLSMYEAAEPRFGNGAVFEQMPMLRRWERLAQAGITQDYLDLDWTLAACQTEARLCAVPKQWDKDRLITVEPSETTWLQHKTRLALGRTLCNNGFRSIVDQGISGYDGPRFHRRRALEASVYAGVKSDWSTIDLSDASDGITWDQVSWIFPPEVVACLDRARSESFLFKDLLGKVQSQRMYIYAGMGNATTFMVESILFYALMQASCKLRGVPVKGTSVVGDDMMLNGLEQYEATLWGLATLGYRCNSSKTFSGLNCPVRESCGVWAFNGFDVQVPAFKGYADEGLPLLSLAEYVRSAPKCIEYALLTRLNTWANTPYKIPGTVSVQDSTRAVTHSCIRWNRRIQQLQCRCLTATTAERLVPANYECSPVGALAVLTRQVPTIPVPLTTKPHGLMAATRAARQRFAEVTDRELQNHIWSMGGSSVMDLIPNREDLLDQAMYLWCPDKWKAYVIGTPDPYSIKLAHRWVTCSAQAETRPPDSASYVELRGTKVLCNLA